MKKLILALAILFCLLASAFAETITDKTPRENGDVDYQHILSQLSLWDRLLIGSSPLTTVNGKTCQEYPAESFEYENVTADCIYRDFDFTLQIFQVNPWKYLGEKKSELKPGDYKSSVCVDLPKYQKIHLDIFKCDITDKICSDFKAICSDKDSTMYERKCIVGDNTYTEKETRGWGTSGVPSCTAVPPPVTPPLPTDKLKIGITGVRFSPNYYAGEIQTGATFKAETAGRYYLEAALLQLNQAQAIMADIGSKCDGKESSSGKYVDLKAGELADIVFTMKTVAPFDMPGTYIVNMGAYSGCLKDGGVTLAEKTQRINIISDSTADKTNFLTVPNIAGAGLIIVGIFALSYGIIWYGALFILLGLLPIIISILWR